MILASTLLLLVGIVTFIIGVFTESGLSMIVVSIGSSALAALTLFVGVLRDRKRLAPAPSGDAAVFTGTQLRDELPSPVPYGSEAEQAPLLADVPAAAEEEVPFEETLVTPVEEEPVADVFEPVASASPVSPSVRAARSAATSAKRTTTRKPAAAKSTTAKKPAARTAASKTTTAKKPAAKSTTAKKPAASRTAAAKSTTAKKPAAKSTAAKKTTTKSSTTAKKPAARKPAAKKPPAEG